MAVYGSYVIETWNDVSNEILFVSKDGHWTPFLTDAMSFKYKRDAIDYWENCKLPNIDIDIKWYG